MLKIRLTRTGKKSQPSYRIVVAEHTAPIKSQFVEIIGNYNISRNPRELIVDQDRVKYWISVGAQPTDTVATLLKGLGMEGMDKYIGRRDLQRKKKKTTEEDSGGSAKVTEEAPAEEDAAPAEEAEAPAKKEPKAEEDEAPAKEEPAEAKAEEPKAEEADEVKTEKESPAEEAADTPVLKT